MLKFPGKISIIIHPAFWISALLIGWISSGSFIGMLVWMFVILVSVVVHEFGHAVAALFFGKEPQIELIAMGGITTYNVEKLKFYQQFLITLFGPLFGFCLFLIASLILSFNLFHSAFILALLDIFKKANLFWTIVNLFPVLPFDGGQLLRIPLEALFGIRGLKASLLFGFIVSLSLSLILFALGYFILGALFFLFTFQNFATWKKTKSMSDADRKEEVLKKIEEGEKAFLLNDMETAGKNFAEARAMAKQGVLFGEASYYLALIEFNRGKLKEAYELLLPVKELLEDKALCLLQQLAFEEKDFKVVADLSSFCFQIQPTKEIALRNARSFAFLKQPKEAGGWLKRALQFEGVNLTDLLLEDFFDNVRNDPLFTHFFKS